MDESLLVRTALIACSVGFIGLILVLFFQEPLFSSPQEDTLTSMDVKINDLYFTQEGTIIVYAQEQSGYIDTLLDKDLIGSTARLTGRLEGDFFSLEFISVLEPSDHS